MPTFETQITPYREISFKLCFLKARSLHKHIDDVRKDFNYSSTDVNIFAETRYAHSDNIIAEQL